MYRNCVVGSPIDALLNLAPIDCAADLGAPQAEVAQRARQAL